ncbi:hypothetical protein [Ferrimonas kyonanensis]|uniref:hypothetical protein n=1 Tax=Ferrimonas kyonanensis TaxID=364763 RepID=UPI00040FA313|nr:hypothetical protein [Ferrimonas kyonanensis]
MKCRQRVVRTIMMTKNNRRGGQDVRSAEIKCQSEDIEAVITWHHNEKGKQYSYDEDCHSLTHALGKVDHCINLETNLEGFELVMDVNEPLPFRTLENTQLSKLTSLGLCQLDQMFEDGRFTAMAVPDGHGVMICIDFLRQTVTACDRIKAPVELAPELKTTLLSMVDPVLYQNLIVEAVLSDEGLTLIDVVALNQELSPGNLQQRHRILHDLAEARSIPVVAAALSQEEYQALKSKAFTSGLPFQQWRLSYLKHPQSSVAESYVCPIGQLATVNAMSVSNGHANLYRYGEDGSLIPFGRKRVPSWGEELREFVAVLTEAGHARHVLDWTVVPDLLDPGQLIR